LDDPVNPAPATSNAFDISLAGARRVQLDLERMGIDPGTSVTGTIDTEAPLTLRLKGYGSLPDVIIGAESWSLDGDVLVLELAAGSSTVTIGHLPANVI
jgi:hypothetical protein